MVRDGIRTMLEAKSDQYKFILAESESGEDAISKVQQNDYDIVLMDYQLPGMNGAEAVHHILRYQPKMKILAISNYDEFSYIRNMMDAGAKGYMLKNTTPTEIVNAIGIILNGKEYYANEIAVKLIDHKLIGDDETKVKTTGLSRRQIEVLKGLAKGQSHEEVAKELYISKRTVDSHRQNIIKKLGVKNIAGLVKFAAEHKLLD